MATRLAAYLVALIVGTTFIAGLIVGAQRDDEGPVDLVVVNGHVYTGDGAGTMAEAVAIQGNKILHVGTTREVQRLRRAQTVVIDAKGGAVLPGFIDGHAHFVGGGLALSQINLLDARTLPDIQQAVRRWASAHPDRPWITGRGWYYEPFSGGLPTRQMLDDLVPDRPAYLTAYDGHTGWANTAALKLASITRRTPNPLNGIVVKDPKTGEPTGVLKESAMALVARLVPQPTRNDQIAAIRAATAEAHRHGVTSVQNARGSEAELELYDELRRKGELSVRIHSALSADAGVSAPELDAMDALRDKYSDDPLFKAGAVEIVTDGGTARLTPDALNRLVAELDKRGWQIMIQAIGDRAIRMALDAYEHAMAANPAPARGRRHRIEHTETTDPADVPRFGALGVVASMQPSHGLPDPTQMAVWKPNLGDERASPGWVYASIAKRGGRVVFGSDWPVVSMDPLLGLQIAVGRQTPDGQPAERWNRAERVSLEQAIDAYTRIAAWASFDEHRKGTLARDMLADVVVLSKDIFDQPARLSDAEVMVTIFDGKVVYRKPVETDN